MSFKDVDSTSKTKKTVRFEEHDVPVKPFLPLLRDSRKTAHPEDFFSPKSAMKNSYYSETRQAGLDWSQPGTDKTKRKIQLHSERKSRNLTVYFIFYTLFKTLLLNDYEERERERERVLVYSKSPKVLEHCHTFVAYLAL